MKNWEINKEKSWTNLFKIQNKIVSEIRLLDNRENNLLDKPKMYNKK